MRKNMFYVIKLIALSAIILTTCNIDLSQDEKLSSKEITKPNYFQQLEYKIDEEKTNDNEQKIDEEITYIEDEVMGEINNVDDIVYEPIVEEVVEPVIEETKTEEIIKPVVEEVIVETIEPVVETTNETVSYNTDYAYQVLYLINQIRKENGLNELTMNYTLIEIANIRSEEITRYWSHTRPDGTDWWTIYQQYGLYGKFGENLAYGQENPEEVVQAWMNSETHRANILNAEFNKIGISSYNNDGIYYWSQEFSD